MVRQLLLLFFIVTGLLLNSQLQAQSKLPYQWYVNANAGFTQMYGDIENESDPIGKFNGETNLGYGLKVGGYISPVFTWRFQFLNSNFEAYRDVSNLKFETQLTELQLGASASFSNLFFGYKDRLVDVYGLVGIGTLLYRSKLINTSIGYIENSVGYTDDGQKSNRELSVSFPIGAGVDFRVSDRFLINLETAIRFTNTDELDAAKKGANNDAFYYTSLGLTYRFIKSKQPEKVIVPPAIPEKVNKYAGTYINLSYIYPQELNSMDEFVMTSHISKGKIKGKAELTQILPIGFNVLDTIIGSARIKFRNYTLSLYWDEIPADTAFDISYRVKLDKIFGSLPMTSLLYFEETREEYKFKTDIFIKRKITAEAIAVVDDKPSEEEMQSSPSDKVEFRIQLRASYNLRLSTDSLARIFGLDEKITEEKIGRWYKYSVGSFKTYEEAKNYRSEINGKPGIKDPFIIAYYDGKRLNKLSELRDLAPETLPGGEQAKPKFKENGYCWRVQILAMQSKQASPSALQSIYNIDEVVNEEIYHNWSKYTVGDCLTKQQAIDLRLELVKKGLDGAFLVKYHDGERAALK